MSLRVFLPGLAAFIAAGLVALLGLRASADSPPTPPSDPPSQRQTSTPPPTGTVTLRLLGVNDFHGHLEPPQPDLGGAAWLKANLDAAGLPGRTIRVHAGDMLGASPLISSWFHDEPTVEFGNELGFDVGTLGNHEFDEGGDELLRLLHGGQRTGPEALKRDVGGKLVNTSSPDFSGTHYPTISANVFERDGGLVLPPTAVVERDGVRVGFIGVTTTSTPTFVLPRHSERFRFGDISDAVNRWVPELRRQGVQAIVVLAHEGAPSQDQDDAPHATGTIVDEARQMSDAVDVVIAGHSHSVIDMDLPNTSGRGHKTIVEAGSYGVAFDQVDMTIDRGSGEVVSTRSVIVPTRHGGDAPAAPATEPARRPSEDDLSPTTPAARAPEDDASPTAPATRAPEDDASPTAPAARAPEDDASRSRTTGAALAPDPRVAALVARYAQRVAPLANHVVGTAPAPITRANGELGALAAEAQRAFARTDLGLVNSGSMRGDVDAGPIHYAELFEAQAYDHRLMRIKLRGRQLQALLDDRGDKIYAAGVPHAIDPDATYSAAANELFATNGAFPPTVAATARPVGTEVQALAWYLEHPEGTQ